MWPASWWRPTASLRADGIEQLDDNTIESTVLLGHSYFLLLDPKQHAKMKPYPPLNTLHAATVLRQEGLSVAVFDAMLANDESDFLASLQRHRPQIVVLFEDNFNFLSKMCLTRMREAALTMIGMAREAGCRVAVCGADVTDHPEVYLEAGAEACLLGEGEHTMREVVSRWLSDDPQQSLADIPGIAVLVDGDVSSNFASYTLLRFEINVRSAAVLGFVGAGGIGQTLLEVIRKFYYADISAILLLIVLTVMIIDGLTAYVRHRLIDGEPSA